MKAAGAKDMTKGPILRELVLFSLPLLVGNIFQQLYNTVDSIVVGRFVGSDALGAVTGVMPAINTLIGLFLGLSTGASVVVSQLFGAGNRKGLRRAVHSAMVLTLIMGIIMMAVGYAITPALLRFMKTPDSIMEMSQTYLRIYFLGILGLMYYNMTSGVLRAVGDSQRPLYFLIVTSIINVILDLLFVAAFGMGVEGVALATVIAQFVSSFMGLYVLFRSPEDYSITWKEMKMDRAMTRKILVIGLPTGIQMSIINFSNVFVQGYINHFGAASTAGWGTYLRVDAFVVLPIITIASAVTTFTGQNAGAGKVDRIKGGIRSSMILSVAITLVICILEFIFAAEVVKLFNTEAAVVEYGTLYIHLNCLFDVLCAGNQVYAAVLSGIGDAKGPTLIMIFSFVVFRQIYLLVISHIMYTPVLVSLGYPAGWLVCNIIMTIYLKRSHWERKVLPETER